MQTLLFMIFALVMILITGESLEIYQLFFFFLLLVLGYSTGSIIEKRHFRSIREREAATVDLSISSLMKKFPMDQYDVAEARLVTGSAVISMDFFKMVLAGLINLFGGAVVPYESLLDRARREAALRMKDEAKGADFIVNARIETANIGSKSDSGVGCVEAVAYGTAIYLKK